MKKASIVVKALLLTLVLLSISLITQIQAGQEYYIKNISESELQRHIISILKDKYADDKSSLKIQALVPVDKIPSKEKITKKATIELLQQDLAKRMAAKISYVSTKGPSHKIWWFKIQKYRNVFIASRRLEKNRIILPNDFAIKKIDVLSLKEDSITSDVVGKLVSRMIPKGSLILKEKIEDRPEIIIGDAVKLVATFNGITISDRAIAVTNSDHLGFVSVKTSLGSKPVNTIIISPGVVEYVLP